MGLEMDSFQKDLLESVRQMNADMAAREVRAKMGLSQRAFAQLLGVSLRTLQDWEQGCRRPAGAAQTLLRVASQHPEALRDLRNI